MDIVKSIGELLHENVFKDLECIKFRETKKNTCKIRLTFECQRCFMCLPSWNKFVEHLLEHPGVHGDASVESHVDSVAENVVEKTLFPLPPKKNKLAWNEASNERLRSRNVKVSAKEDVVNADLENSEHSRLENCDEDLSVKTKRRRGRPPKRKADDVTPNLILGPTETNQGNGSSARISTRQMRQKIVEGTDSPVQREVTMCLTEQNDKCEGRDSTENAHQSELTADQEPKNSTAETKTVVVSVGSDGVLSPVDMEETAPNIDPECTEESEVSERILTENNDTDILDILNVKEEEYAVMSRDQKEDLKARTCPFCYEVLPELSDCLPHYKLKHDYAPKACVNITNQEFRPNSGGRGIKAADTCNQCQFCGKFFLKDKIERHVILVHVWRSVQRNSKRKKQSLCDICGQVFGYVHNLAVHRQCHFKTVKRAKRTTQYVCDVCGYSTPERQRLTFHTMSQHENKKAFKCTHANCSYETWERSSFRCHMFTHSNDKKYKCSYCSYQCIQLKQLRNHLQKQHMVSLPKKYEVGVDASGKKTVKVVIPRTKDEKAEVPCVEPKDVLYVTDDNGEVEYHSNDPHQPHQAQHETQVTVTTLAPSQYNMEVPHGEISVPQEQIVLEQDQEMHANMPQHYTETDQQAELQDPSSKPQVMEQEYYHQEQVVSEDGGTPYMLLYPSDLGENTYTPVPQAVAEVLVTTNTGEQVQLHLYPPSSKSSDVQHHPLPLEPTSVSAEGHVTMATQEVSMVTGLQTNESDGIPISVGTNQLHPVTSQVNYVPVINASDVISACPQPLVEGSMPHHHHMAAPDPSNHLVINSSQQSMGFVNESQSAIISETSSMLQTDNFSYATTPVMDRGSAYPVHTASQHVELSQVPIMTYSELQRSAPNIQEGQKNVECITNSENTLEQDIARTLIQINDNHI